MSSFGEALKKKISSAIKSDATNVTGGFVQVKAVGKTVSLSIKRAGGCKDVGELKGSNGEVYYPRARIIADGAALNLIKSSQDEFVQQVHGLMSGDRGNTFVLENNTLVSEASDITDGYAMTELLRPGGSYRPPDPMDKIIPFDLLKAVDFKVKSDIAVVSPRSISPSRRGSPRQLKTIDEALSDADGRLTNVASCKPRGSLGNKVLSSSNNPVQFTVGGRRVPKEGNVICFAVPSGPVGTSLAAAKEGAMNFLTRYSTENNLGFSTADMEDAIDRLIASQKRETSPRAHRSGSVGRRVSPSPKRSSRSAPRVSVMKP